MKTIDITEKLHFEEKPAVIIGDTAVTINNSAVAMLEILPKLDDLSDNPAALTKIVELLVPETEREKLSALELSFGDFVTFIEAAVSLVTGDSEGEAVTRTTT